MSDETPDTPTDTAPTVSDETPASPDAVREALHELAPDDLVGALEAARKDAGKYRRQARAAETELEKARATVSAHNRQAAETLAAGKMANGADLWVAGVDLDQLIDDEGKVDPARVADAVDAVLGERPHWAVPKPAQGGFDGGARRHAEPEPDRDETWAKVLQPTRTPVYTGSKPHTVKPQAGTAAGTSAGSATGKARKANPATTPKPPKE